MWQDWQLSAQRIPISVSSWKHWFFYRLMIERISSNFAVDLSLIKSSPLYEELCNFGAIAA
jgi:hypothetical protein